jgi:predicted TIM-barrel fold metal-dependent hydrolase
MPEYSFISADNHIDMLWMPADLWQSRVPAKFRDRAPHVVEAPEGTYWEWEGRTQVVGVGRLPQTASAYGRDNAKHAHTYFGSRGVDIPAGSLPCTDPALLLEHLDLAGIYAGIFYGPTRKWGIEDPELLIEVYRAYNDFAIELSAHAPERILALPLLPTRLPEAAIAEAQRLVELGTRVIEFPPFDIAAPVGDPVWEPLWSIVEEAGVPLCSHIGDKAGSLYPLNEYGQSKAHFSLAPLTLLPPMSQFIFGGVLDRHPGLRLALGECNIGWVPYVLWCMDRQEREREPDPTVELSMLPSEYFYRQITVSFEEDEVGIQAVADGNEALRRCAVWGADYPHNHVTWPNAKTATDGLFGGLPADVRADLLWNNAAEFFGITAPADAVAAAP